LGRVLFQELRSRGHEVYGCDLQHSAKPEVMRADIANHRQLERVFRFAKPDVVYHLAAEFGRNNGEEFFSQLWSTNCIGTQNVIEECLRSGAGLIFASSSEAYGDDAHSLYSQGGTFTEGWLDHYTPTFHNNYALSKWANEKQIHIAAKNRGLRAVNLRFFNAFGPGEFYTPYRSVVCLFIYRLMHGLPITVYKNYWRVFMYVDDWARTTANVCERFDGLIERAIANPLTKDGFCGSRPACVPTYNIGGKEYTTVEAMKDKILALLGTSESEISYLDAEKANVTCKRPDISLARRDLDHDPKITLDEGLPKTISWLASIYGHK